MTSDDALDRILASAGVRCVYQPIVDLSSGSIVAYEALARGPAESPLERPDALFDAARAAGRLVELDWACREAAFLGAVEGGLSEKAALFVNVEAETFGHPPPAGTRELLQQATRFSIVVEVTERALTDRPAQLLSTVDRMRSFGFGVGLDDVGADARSLALMPFLSPDVVKLDLRLVQQRANVEIAAIVNAVAAHAERTGAVVLAEGIETDEHVETALAVGATFGQGWYFGRPGPLVDPDVAPSVIPKLEPPPRTDPVELVGGSRPSQRGRKHLLSALSAHLEHEAENQREPSVVLAAVQSAEHFGAVLRARYARLAERAALVGVLGAGLSPQPGPRIRGGHLTEDDPLRGVWALCVVGPHFAAALVAFDLGDDGPETERRFQFTVTHGRETVLETSRALMGRITPIEEP